MRGSLAKLFCSWLVLAGLAGPSFAEALEKPGGKSGAGVDIAPVSVASLPEISDETIGVTDEMKADMWRGTSRDMAERLLASVSPSQSPVLNALVIRLLRSAAVPPEGKAKELARYTSARIEKLVQFGDFKSALALARRADAKLVSATAFRQALESAFASGDEGLCEQLTALSKGRSAADFQRFQILCRLRAGNGHTAQVALDVLQADKHRDSVFLEVAGRNILGASKTLPALSEPVSFATAALLRLANIPLPDSVYVHAKTALARALLPVPARNEATKLAFIERAAERGVIGANDLAGAYRGVSFSDAALAAPFAAGERGARLRALLFRAALAQSDEDAKVELSEAFLKAASPALMNGAGGVVALMLGDVEPETARLDKAALFVRIFLAAQKEALAQSWMALARTSPEEETGDFWRLWPQLAAGGFEPEADFTQGFARWFDAATADGTGDAALDAVASTLLVLDADDVDIPETAWARVFRVDGDAKNAGVSALLFERMQAAAAHGRLAETAMLAVTLAGEGEIPLQAKTGIISAFRTVGLEAEADAFAREAVASLARETK